MLRAPKLTVHSFGITDQGRVRESNQDQFVNAKLSRAIQLQQSSLAQPKTLFGDEHGHLFVVADGMGGHAGGQEASALAVISIEEFVLNTLKWFSAFKATTSSPSFKWRCGRRTIGSSMKFRGGRS